MVFIQIRRGSAEPSVHGLFENKVMMLRRDLLVAMVDESGSRARHSTKLILVEGIEKDAKVPRQLTRMRALCAISVPPIYRDRTDSLIEQCF